MGRQPNTPPSLFSLHSQPSGGSQAPPLLLGSELDKSGPEHTVWSPRIPLERQSTPSPFIPRSREEGDRGPKKQVLSAGLLAQDPDGLWDPQPGRVEREASALSFTGGGGGPRGRVSAPTFSPRRPLRTGLEGSEPERDAGGPSPGVRERRRRRPGPLPPSPH